MILRLCYYNDQEIVYNYRLDIDDFDLSKYTQNYR